MLRQAAIPGATQCKPELIARSFKTHSLVVRSTPARPEVGTSAGDLGGVVFGMSEQQVQRLLGGPTTRQGSCWKYALLPTSAAAAVGAAETDVGVCFFAGRVAYTS
jgi:hypothetical protein